MRGDDPLYDAFDGFLDEQEDVAALEALREIVQYVTVEMDSISGLTDDAATGLSAAIAGLDLAIAAERKYAKGITE